MATGLVAAAAAGAAVVSAAMTALDDNKIMAAAIDRLKFILEPFRRDEYLATDGNGLPKVMLETANAPMTSTRLDAGGDIKRKRGGKHTDW